MTKENEILSDLVVFMKYAKYLPELGRRETWEELVSRNMLMHVKKFPELSKEIMEVYERSVYTKKVLPSMRSLQFAGLPIEVNAARLYNCSYCPIDDYRAFSEAMFLLLSGVGFGYSVQKHHINKLPDIKKPSKNRRYVVSDSIHGWADSIKILMNSYFTGKSKPLFDFRDIRPKGALLITSGGKAPGPEPLKRCLFEIEQILDRYKDGEKLTPIDCHSILCHIADSVLAGGIRRSAMISLFTMDDEDMLSCKSGNWWETNPHFARANNSAVVVTSRIKKKEFNDLWAKIKASNAGEPGLYFTNDPEYGTNPCKPLKSTILTDKGYITFEQALQLPEEDLTVMGTDGKWKKASKPFKTGVNRKIVKFTLSNGQYLYGTDNHHHFKYDEGFKRMDEFQIGDWLQWSNKNIYNLSTLDYDSQDFEEGLALGWMHGDGWYYKRSDSSGYKAGLCFGSNEMDVVKYFEDYLHSVAIDHNESDNCKVITYSSRLIELCEIHNVSLDKTDLTWLYGKSPEFKIGFIKAMFTADGSVRNQNNVEVYSTRRSALEVINNILNEFGINNTITVHGNAKNYIASDMMVRNNQTCYKINVYAGQFKKIGFICKYKNDLLALQSEKPIYRYSDYASIVDINWEDSVEDVYDITVYDDTHAFYDSGIVTHNCVETSLRPNTFCNLVEINGGTIESQEDLNQRSKDAAFINTLQASYTDFYYLRDIWKKNTEKDALIGTGITGIGSGFLDNLDKKVAAEIVITENERVANLIGINKAARCTVIKPAGTSSIVLGTSSGIHAYHDEYYLRRMRINKNESIYSYLLSTNPDLIEDELFKPNDTSIITIPQKSPINAHLRNESALTLLERVKEYNMDWVREGHRKGPNYHNVSATISIKPDEWETVGTWMWSNKDTYHGLSILPYDDHTYQQAPFETCSKETYEVLLEKVNSIDLSLVKEEQDNTNLSEQSGCAGGACEVK